MTPVAPQQPRLDCPDPALRNRARSLTQEWVTDSHLRKLTCRDLLLAHVPTMAVFVRLHTNEAG